MDKTPTPLYILSSSKTDLLRKIKHLCKSLTCAKIFGMSDTMQRPYSHSSTQLFISWHLLAASVFVYYPGVNLVNWICKLESLPENA